MPTQNVYQLQETLKRRLLQMGSIDENGLSRVVSLTESNLNLSFTVHFTNPSAHTAFVNHVLLSTDFIYNFSEGNSFQITIPDETRITSERLETLLSHMAGFLQNQGNHPYGLHRSYHVNSGQVIRTHFVSPDSSQNANEEEQATQLDNLDDFGQHGHTP